jgi:hypothetical protein
MAQDDAILYLAKSREKQEKNQDKLTITFIMRNNSDFMEVIPL